MRIENENIVIRSARQEDAAQLNRWWNDGRVMAHAGFPRGLGQSIEETRESLRQWEGKLDQVCIIEIDGKAVGELSYRLKGDGAAYPGWKLCDSDYQNQGYGPKIIKMLFHFLFTDERIKTESPVDRIVWDTMLENKRAQHVYEEKLKAKRTGIKKDLWRDQAGKWRSAVFYEMSREAFFETPMGGSASDEA